MLRGLLVRAVMRGMKKSAIAIITLAVTILACGADPVPPAASGAPAAVTDKASATDTAAATSCTPDTVCNTDCTDTGIKCGTFTCDCKKSPAGGRCAVYNCK